jgi:2-methylaconitate cis-trans-isomerase PrpF
MAAAGKFLRAGSRLPFVLYRSGTSRGPFVLEADVPPKGDARDAVLCRLMGSGHAQQLEGLGGGAGPTSKAVIVGPGPEEGSVTYTFAQCRVAEASVDHSHGDCGNMVAAVAPFALERGLVSAPSGASSAHVRIHSLVTGAIYAADVALAREGAGTIVNYDGDFAVPGVPSPAAPVRLTTYGVAGSQTGTLLPTGRAVDKLSIGSEMGEVSATIVDFARALIIFDADEVLPLFGYTSLQELTKANVGSAKALNQALNHARLHAGQLIGMGDCTGKDAPKVALVGRHSDSGVLSSRYWVNPERNELHPSMAMTAAQALGAAALLHGSVVRRMFSEDPKPDATLPGMAYSFGVAHAEGVLQVTVGVKESQGDESFPWGTPDSGKFTTTVRPIAEGTAFV